KIAKDDQHFGGQRALLLFENPQDVLEAIEGGVPLDTINVGSMAHSTGKVQPNRTLAFNQDDIDTFNKLFEHGLTFDVRKVPGDSGENMQNILERAQNELNRNAYYQSKGGKIMELTVIQIILVLFVAFLAGVE